MGTATVMALGFLAIIAIGAVLLMLPISSASGEFTSPLTAMFTAVSATCVTGLVVVESGLYWSLFGKIVIIVLIQIGGLGFMTMAVLLSVIIRRSLSPRDRVLVAASTCLSSEFCLELCVLKVLERFCFPCVLYPNLVSRRECGIAFFIQFPLFVMRDLIFSETAILWALTRKTLW